MLAAIAIVPVRLITHLVQKWARMKCPCSVWLVVRVPFPTSFAVLYGSIAAIRTDNTHCLGKLMSFLLARTLVTSLVRRSNNSQTRNMSGLPFADLRARKIASSSSRFVGSSSTNEGFRRLNLATRVATSLRRNGSLSGVIIVRIGYSPDGGISEMHHPDTYTPVLTNLPKWYRSAVNECPRPHNLPEPACAARTLIAVELWLPS